MQVFFINLHFKALGLKIKIKLIQPSYFVFVV